MVSEQRFEPLPPPGLFSAEIPNLGPAIDPPFADVPSYRDYLVPPNISPVESSTIRTAITPARTNGTSAALCSGRTATESLYKPMS